MGRRYKAFIKDLTLTKIKDISVHQVWLCPHALGPLVAVLDAESAWVLFTALFSCQ